MNVGWSASESGKDKATLASEQHLKDLLEPTVEAIGFELIRVRYTGGKKPVLQIMAERADGSMSVEDCADLSRELAAVLDVEDPIAGEYSLEVSSPGVDRPLTRLKDFDNWAGFEAKLELREPVDGQKRFRGMLDGIEGNEVRLETKEFGILGFSFDMIDKAKLVMTDELLKETLKKQKAPTGE